MTPTALEITITAAVTSFKDPSYSGLQRCLPCPPPATIGGLLAAAAGGWDRVDPATRFAAAFTHRGDGTDLEIWHPVTGRTTPVPPQLKPRQFLVDATLTIWITADTDTWYRRMRRPVWPLHLGRSQDLVGLSLRRTVLRTRAGTPAGHAVLPADAGRGNQMLATAVSLVRTRGMAKLLDLRPQFIWGIILVFCVVGTYATTNNIWTVAQMLVFGMIGLLLRRVGLPAGPVVLGFLLGPLAEANARRALLIGDLSGFLTHPFAAGFLLLALGSLIWPQVRALLRRRNVTVGS